jgi:hypothetical protein
MTSIWRGSAALPILLLGLTWGCAAAPPCPNLEAAPLAISQVASVSNVSSEALKQKVKAQEKRISELSMQLNLLRRIDHDRTKDR